MCQELCSEIAQDLQKEGLKGRTVTVKLKNVNFEVKTRASTVSSVVSTEEEIFAIAKELLRTEIDAASPYPLRLRLMGVRISSFPSEADKKHQQRSIIGFLQAGNQALSAPGCTGEKTDKDQCLKPQKMSHEKSFFDRKRLERKWSHQDTSQCETVDKPNLYTSPPFLVIKETNEGSETSESSDRCQTFTCPVCFRKQENINLETFNRHVDACLDGPSVKENCEVFACAYASSADGGQKENTHHSSSLWEKQDCETHQKNGEVTSEDRVDLVTARDSSSKPESADCLRNKHSAEEHSSVPTTPSGTVSLADADVELVSGQEVAAGQALVCPVCNLEQNTSDLDLFNEHVDICLNKGVIQELRNESRSVVSQPQGSSRSTGTSSKVQKTVTKTKRPGLMTKHSTSKKIKPNNPRHTLDTFFK